MERIKIAGALDKSVLFSLYAIAFFLPISKAIIESLSILAIIGYIVKKIIQRQNLPKTPLNLAVFSYLLICFFSIFISSNLKISARTSFAKVTQDVLFFFVALDTLNDKRRIKNIIYMLFLSSLLLGLDGLYQHFTHKDFIRNRPYYGLPRIHATFPTPNDFGCYLVAIIPFALVLSFSKFVSKRLRLLVICLVGLLFASLILTVSRGAWLALLSAMLFMSIWVRVLGISFLVLGIFIMITQQFYYPLLKERLGNLFIFADHSSMDRKIIWQTAWRMFRHKPWLGVGIGTFMFNFSKFVKDYAYGVPYAHNCYLQIGCEVGIIGLLSFLSILVLFFYYGIKVLNLKQKTFHWYIILASLASILGYCIQMAVDTIFYSLDLGMLFWLILGLGAAAMRCQELEYVP